MIKNIQPRAASRGPVAALDSWNVKGMWGCQEISNLWSLLRELFGERWQLCSRQDVLLLGKKLRDFFPGKSLLLGCRYCEASLGAMNPMQIVCAESSKSAVLCKKDLPLIQSSTSPIAESSKGVSLAIRNLCAIDHISRLTKQTCTFNEKQKYSPLPLSNCLYSIPSTPLHPQTVHHHDILPKASQPLPLQKWTPLRSNLLLHQSKQFYCILSLHPLWGSN